MIAAIDADRAACDKGSAIRNQECDQIRDFFRTARAPQRICPRKPGRCCRTIDATFSHLLLNQRRQKLGFDILRAHRVDPNVVPRNRVRNRLLIAMSAAFVTPDGKRSGCGWRAACPTMLIIRPSRCAFMVGSTAFIIEKNRKPCRAADAQEYQASWFQPCRANGCRRCSREYRSGRIASAPRR